MTEKLEIDIAVFTGPVQMELLQKAIDLFCTFAEFSILESLTDISFPAPSAGKIFPRTVAQRKTVYAHVRVALGKNR